LARMLPSVIGSMGSLKRAMQRKAPRGGAVVQKASTGVRDATLI